MRRSNICLCLGPTDDAELEALRAKRKKPGKLAYRVGIGLATADRVGTVEIMLRTGIHRISSQWRGASVCCKPEIDSQGIVGVYPMEQAKQIIVIMKGLNTAEAA
jgi:hypothetical protein